MKQEFMRYEWMRTWEQTHPEPPSHAMDHVRWLDQRWKDFKFCHD